jgi:hypothetical protein
VIPLLVLALALGVGLATYELSPRAHAWVDEHARAIREALAAHRAADAHLAAAETAPHPAIAVDHASAAAAANRDAARETVAAAQAARTDDQRASASRSAVLVVAREGAIAGVHADAHLAAAAAAEDPTVAVQHAHEATVANQASAEKTAVTAAAARTEKDRQAAAAAAAKVVDREGRIAAALAKLGVGQCGVRSYAGVSPQSRDALLAKLHAEGMTVTGDNPWDIETHSFDVKLRAVWDPQTQALKIIVTSGAGGYAGIVTCSQIWARIDPKVKEILGA